MTKRGKKKNVIGTRRVLVASEVPCAIVEQLNAYYFGQDQAVSKVDILERNVNRLNLSLHWETSSMQAHFDSMSLARVVAEIDIEISDFISGISARSNIDQWTWTENLWHVFITHIGEYSLKIERTIGSIGYRRRRLFVSKAMDCASDLVSDEEIYDSIRSWKLAEQQCAVKPESRRLLSLTVKPNIEIESVGNRPGEGMGRALVAAIASCYDEVMYGLVELDRAIGSQEPAVPLPAPKSVAQSNSEQSVGVAKPVGESGSAERPYGPKHTECLKSCPMHTTAWDDISDNDDR